MEFIQEMSKREQPDHFEFSAGTPSKGNAVTLKVYFDIADIDAAQKKIDNALKVREYLIGKGIMVRE